MSAPLAAEVIDRVTLDNEKQRFGSIRISPAQIAISLTAEVITTIPSGYSDILFKQSEIKGAFDGLYGYRAVV
jgi:hypothetical protein